MKKLAAPQLETSSASVTAELTRVPYPLFGLSRSRRGVPASSGTPTLGSRISINIQPNLVACAAKGSVGGQLYFGPL
jgi:hypothetical protein